MYPIRFAGENDTNSRSANIWHHAEPILSNLARGDRQLVLAHQRYRFDGALDDEEYVETQATAGTFVRVAPTDATPGFARLDSGSTTENQGCQVQFGVADTAVIPAFIPVANTTIFFELMCRFNEAPATSPPDAFLGLSAVDTSIIASGANSSPNHVGFELINEDATLDFVSEKAGSRDTNSDVATLAEDTWYKFGFIVHGVTKIESFVDGTIDATKMTDTDDLPIVAMAPSLVCQASGTAAAQPEIDIRWMEVLQVNGLMPGLGA